MNNIFRKLISILCILFTLISLLSCKADYVELKETTNESLSKNSNGIVSKEIVTTPTINFDEILAESSEINNEESIISDTIQASDDANIETTESEVDIVESTTETELFVEIDDRVYHGNVNIDTNLIGWQYGKTPCEWVYIEPGIQLISNYKPNTSEHYSIKSKVSSGLKGCYIPVFIKTDMMSNEYDGRFYVFEDYKKETPDNMLFDNTLNTIKYKGQTIEEILRSNMTLTKTSNGLLKNGEEYINIVYVTDLDKYIS